MSEFVRVRHEKPRSFALKNRQHFYGRRGSIARNEVSLPAERCRSVSFIAACGPTRTSRRPLLFLGELLNGRSEAQPLLRRARRPADEFAATTRFPRAGFGPECDTHSRRGSSDRVNLPGEGYGKGAPNIDPRGSRVSVMAAAARASLPPVDATGRGLVVAAAGMTLRGETLGRGRANCTVGSP